nr:putative glycosyltransferase [Vibrio metoecus]
MIFYAPNIHVGGGLELLKSLFGTVNFSSDDIFVLDARLKYTQEVSKLSNVHYIEPTPIARFRGELLIKKLAMKQEKIFCFHGLPPLFPSKAEVKVFLQNRLYIIDFSLRNYPAKVAARLLFEKLIFRIFSASVDEFIVQSNSMKNALQTYLGERSTNIVIAPFANINRESYIETSSSDKEFDFIYVADDSDHKNHLKLLEAWSLLAEQGVYPRLALTLPKSSKYKHTIATLVNNKRCQIHDLGFIPRNEVNAAYKKAAFLIYPSLVESFGLPLLEASSLGLPIVASELDYVRDVVRPIHTFNPDSATSICLAVLRTLGKEHELTRVLTPQQFVEKIL